MYESLKLDFSVAAEIRQMSILKVWLCIPAFHLLLLINNIVL